MANVGSTHLTRMYSTKCEQYPRLILDTYTLFFEVISNSIAEVGFKW